MDLEEADLSLLLDAGYQFPETFQVKADDGVTDIYGVMYKPYDFDPTKNYPIVASGNAQFASGGSFGEFVAFAEANDADTRRAGPAARGSLTR